MALLGFLPVAECLFGRNLLQVLRVREMLKRGLGVHHAGGWRPTFVLHLLRLLACVSPPSCPAAG